MNIELNKRIAKVLSDSNMTVTELSKRSMKYSKGSFIRKSFYRWLSGERRPNLISLRVIEKITKCKKNYLTNAVLK